MQTTHIHINGDSRQMNLIADESVHLIITSPPYWQLKDYGTENQIGFHDNYENYINNLNFVWKECYRILKPGGTLLSGFDLFTNFIVDDEQKEIIFSLPFDPLKNPDQMKKLQEWDDGVQFSHSLEEQIGGQLEAGFTLLDLYEDTYGEGRLHEMNIPEYLATRSVKK